jgi:hypothetical protein
MDTYLTPTLDTAGLALAERHRAWWQRRGMLLTEVEGAPLSDLWLPLADGTLATEDLDLLPSMLDVDRLVGDPLEPGPLGATGDQFWTAAAYSRVPWVEAILGSPIRVTIQGGSMRAHPAVKSLHEWEQRPLRLNQAWLNLLIELTRKLVERSGGRRAVTHTLMRGPSDLAEAVLGPELMSFAMYDQPAALRRFLEEATEIFIEVLRAQQAVIPPIHGGYVNPFGIWAPGSVVRTQCDASAFLSPKHYAGWYLPYDARISQAVDYSVIHLHSSSLHTVAALVESDYPLAIQIIIETNPGCPTFEKLLSIARRILEKKPLILEGPMTPAEIERARRELPTDGLCIIARRAAW